MSYNPNPDLQNVSVISAGSTVTEVNRFPVGIGSTGYVTLKTANNPISFSNPLPVSLGSSNITITGDVNVGTTVSVTSSPQNPVHSHITEVGTSGLLQDENIPYLPVGIGTVNIGLDYLPVGISTLKNTVSISNTAFYITNPVTSVSVTGIGSTVNILGTVSVGNTVSISNTSFYVTGVGGSVSIANTAFYITNPVTTVAVSGIGSTVNILGTVSVGNTVSIANTAFYITNPVTTVAVSGIGSTVNILGTVSVGNTVSISNTSFYVTGVGGSVSIANTAFYVTSIGSTVTVQGTVGIGTTGQVSLNLNSAPVSFANPFPVSLGSSNITITGDVNVGTTVSVTSTPENPVHTHITEVGSSGILQDMGVPYMPVGVGTVNLNLSYLPVGISTFNNTIIIEEPAGSLYAFNNHATNTNRGWTMDDTMRPVMSIRVNSSGTTTSDLAEIVDYQLGNNNANQSTIIYEWYEGNINIAGAAIPDWTSLGTKLQYRIYQDKYSSNAGNTFTRNSSILRHTGIVIGKNADSDEGPSTLYGGATPNMLTLCIRRVDNATKLDIWFAFTCKELS